MSERIEIDVMEVTMIVDLAEHGRVVINWPRFVLLQPAPHMSSCVVSANAQLSGSGSVDVSLVG